ncbi:MAG: glycerophosphodiester phosphodiesterase [Promethearchaeota archaeon]
MARRLLLSGHRGYRAKEIDNTAAAFERAIREGCDFVEFDVKRTRDGELVVFHDKFVNGLLDGSGTVEGLTLSKLKAMRYADGQRVQTLDEFFEQFAGRVKFLLEIKSRGISSRVVRCIHRHGVGRDTIVQSFTARDINRCHAIDPSLEYGLCLAYVGDLGAAGRFLRLHRITTPFFYQVLVARVKPVTWLNLDGPFLYDEFLDWCNKMGKRIILGAQKTHAYVPKLERWHIEMVNADDPADLRARVKHYWRDRFVFSANKG